MAISNNRIESVHEPHVVFRYTPSGTNTSKRRRVTGEEFVRGFLQRTLLPNLPRIRGYGCLSPNSSLKLDRVRMLAWFYLGWCYLMARRHVPAPPAKPAFVCPECGGKLRLVEVTDHIGRVVYSAPLPLLDLS